MKDKPLVLSMWATVCLIPLLGLNILLHPWPQPLNDFDAYWAAGHLFLAGLSPYSLTQMMHVQQQLGSKLAVPMFMASPPWTLPMFALGGSLPFHVAHLLWLAISMVLVLLSALGLWLYFGGSPTNAWIALVIAATYIPLGGAEYVGQVTPSSSFACPPSCFWHSGNAISWLDSACLRWTSNPISPISSFWLSSSGSSVSAAGQFLPAHSLSPPHAC